MKTSETGPVSGAAAAPVRTAPCAEYPVALTVRLAEPGDAVPLGFFVDTALRRDYFLRRGQLEEMLRGPRHRVWVAEIDGVLVGPAITTRGTRLVNALVHPAYRGLGIGRALVERTGAVEARVKCDMHTGDPRGFYRRLGFEPGPRVGRRGQIELMRRAAHNTTTTEGHP